LLRHVQLKAAKVLARRRVGDRPRKAAKVLTRRTSSFRTFAPLCRRSCAGCLASG
jgi:hypothetical protein